MKLTSFTLKKVLQDIVCFISCRHLLEQFFLLSCITFYSFLSKNELVPIMLQKALTDVVTIMVYELNSYETALPLLKK